MKKINIPDNYFEEFANNPSIRKVLDRFKVNIEDPAMSLLVLNYYVNNSLYDFEELQKTIEQFKSSEKTINLINSFFSFKPKLFFAATFLILGFFLGVIIQHFIIDLINANNTAYDIVSKGNKIYISAKKNNTLSKIF